MALMKCPECGSQIPGKSKYCMYCGTPIVEIRSDNYCGLYTILLIRFEPTYKIKIIKAVREELGLGLADAKHFVENLPKIIKDEISLQECLRIQEKFESLSAIVEVRADAESKENYRTLFTTPRPCVPTCPTCCSTNIKKISATKKVVYGAIVGPFSRTMWSEFKCRNCGYMW